MARIVVQLLSLRPRSASGVVYVRHLVPALARALGPERVVLLGDRFARELLGDTGCEFDEVATADWRLARSAAIRRHLPRVVARHRARAVFVPAVPILETDPGVPSVLVVHSHMHVSRPQGQPWGRRLYWELWHVREFVRDVRRAAALVAPTAAFAQELEELIPGTGERTVVVHHGASAAFHPAGSAPRDEPPRVLVVGNAMTYKNPTGALRIFSRAAAGLPHELRLAGLQASEVERLAGQAGLGAADRARLRALGTLGEAELADEYRRARALLFPSLVESFGLPPLEAMASGLPVAASDLPSVREVTAGAAFLAPPSDEPRFAEGLRRLLVDEAEAARRREAGLARAAELTWDRAAASVAALLSRWLS